MTTPVILGGGYLLLACLSFIGFMVSGFATGEGTMTSFQSLYLASGIWLAILIPLACALAYTLTYVGAVKWYWMWLLVPVVLGLAWTIGWFTLFGDAA